MASRTDGLSRALIEYSLQQRQKRVKHIGLVDYRAADELFTYNGIANKIISAPAEDAISSGFTVMQGGTECEDNDNIASALEDLDFDRQFSTALSWDRLYGGAVVLVLANDGGTLEEPLDEKRLKSVERLEVYTPEDVSFTDDYLYDNPLDANFGKPQFYTLTGYYGNSFAVHESRLLLFHGATVSNYTRRMRNGWGGTVFEQVQTDVEYYTEGLRLSLAALSRLSQGVMKLNGMTELMMNEDGEKQLQQRLHLIDLYRHLENTIALSVGDEYDLKNLSLTGIKDILELFQNALSASTGIPSTVLFGRSPAGMSATGESDMENYYNMVRRIQKRTLRPNVMRLVYLLSLASDYKINLPKEWRIEFNPLWNASDMENANVKKLEADTLATKAQAAMAFMNMGALDSVEIRNTLKATGGYEMDESLDKALLERVLAAAEGEA
ncbi:MAG: DUF1073 domain-containing protein [Selenomonadaceae bacterium]|nr:DUF1073 domain-containing protein [Selenomonadaceae bacterium]